jgi:hypothetical protein
MMAIRMLTKQQSQRQGYAAAELSRHCPDIPSGQIVDSLTVGLTRLRDLLLLRIHEDVERYFGMDSMIAPLSASAEEKQLLRAKGEIEAYSAIVVTDEVTQGGYVDRPETWFLEWLFRLRLGERYKSVMDRRVDFYRSPSIEDRRLKFVSVLQRQVPESAKAPLVLFRLFPRALRIVTAVAFGDPLRGQELRAEQCNFLPAVSDCHMCHGRVMDNEEICQCCGNPVWKFTWLCAD